MTNLQRPQAGQRRPGQSQQMALVRHVFRGAEWTDRFRLARYAQRREQHRLAALLFLQHRRGRYLVAQRRGEWFVQSFPRLSDAEQDGRLHHHGFRQHGSQCRVHRNV